MTFPFTCPHCGLQTDVDEEFAGTSGPCRGCSQVVKMPVQASPPPVPLDSDLLFHLFGPPIEATVVPEPPPVVPIIYRQQGIPANWGSKYGLSNPANWGKSKKSWIGNLIEKFSGPTTEPAQSSFPTIPYSGTKQTVGQAGGAKQVKKGINCKYCTTKTPATKTCPQCGAYVCNKCWGPSGEVCIICAEWVEYGGEEDERFGGGAPPFNDDLYGEEE